MVVQSATRVALRPRTKIVATIGPASGSEAVARELIQAGMRVARINFSHGTPDGNLRLLENVRAASVALRQLVAIMVDLQGPRIRVGTLPTEGLELVEQSVVSLHAGVESAGRGVIPVPYDRLAYDVKRGDRILLEDGTKELTVLDVKGPVIRARVVLGGRLLSNKGVNVPTATLATDTMTDKDVQDLVFALRHNIDFVALSFVTTVAQVQKLRETITQALPLGAEPPAVIVKIEKQAAVEAFDALLPEVDGVMIARGDLGLETPITSLPIKQKSLIRQCLLAAKPVIVATEMLGSMEYQPRPTRAEVSDVANAVIDHTDAVMLSGETATGKYPVRAVQTIAEIVANTEESPLDDLRPHREATDEPVPLAVAAAAVELARHTAARAILVTTRSGYSARAVARFRPAVPIIAATNRARTRQHLLLTWGVEPFDVGGYADPLTMVRTALKTMQQAERVQSGDRVVVVSGLKQKRGKYDSLVRLVEV